MHLQRKSAATLLAAFVACSICAQQPAAPPKPATAPLIIRVARGSSGGMSGGGDSTVIEPRSVHWEQHPAYDWTLKGYPDERRTCTITKQDWEGLRSSIDEKVLIAFNGRTECRACVDLPDSWVEVDFSDGTKKLASLGLSNLSPAIADLLRKINAIAGKCPSETVLIGGGGRPTATERYSRKPTKTVEPDYPEPAKSARIQGDVVVTLIVATNGHVEAVTAATGNEKLRTAAVEAVQQWEWEPLLLFGKPSRFRTRAVVHFVLSDNQKSAADAK
jgi:TonB family protein